MKIYQDVLTFLGIKNIHITFNKQSYFAVLMEISGNQWTVVLDEDNRIEGYAKIVVLWNESEIEFNCNITVAPSDNFSIYTCLHILTISYNTDSEEQNLFISKIREIEKNFYEWNKRKEERFEIKENITDIKFDKIEQKVITQEDELPCFVIDISCSGSKIITFSSYFPVGSAICLVFSFREPIEQIPIKAYIRQALKKRDEIHHTNLSILSLEFDHPPIAFQKRMNDFIKRKEEKRSKNV